MSYKKDGSDPTLSRVALLPGLPGGASWPSFVENAARVAQEFIASLLDRRGIQPEEVHRYRRSRRKNAGRARSLRRNMRHVSRRVRLKHRKAA